jgi:hypothetical protein
MRLLAIVVLGLALAGCSKSRCEKYGDMQLKCGHLNDNQEGKAMRLGLVKVCESSSSKSSLKTIAVHMQKEADCADQHDDCVSYRACVDSK